MNRSTFNGETPSESLPLLPLHLIRKYGLEYGEALELQHQWCSEIQAGNRPQTLLLCEHPPVITYGKSASPKSLLSSKETLSEEGIALCQIGRGGDFTYHGPGQLIAYPLLDLRTRKRDVGWYMRGLEQAVIQTLAPYTDRAVRIPDRTGVFLSAAPTQKGEATPRYQKICSIGVRFSRWCSTHGLALYLTDQSHGFRHLLPCGYEDIDVVSCEDLEEIPRRTDLERELIEQFCHVFHYAPESDLRSS
ncbi:lipoyl(octanoyl) transferase LipB [bacterium]|nr:lipoyl(octanoyl) transferase LipB [bacterium]